MRTSAIVLAAGFALLAGGCGARGATPAAKDGALGAPEAPDAARVATPPPTRLPLDAYDLSAAEQFTLDSARVRLEQACLSDFGLGWTVASLVPGEQSERAFSFLDAVTAARQGYHRPVPPIAMPRFRKVPERTTTTAFNVLYGKVRSHDGKAVPAGGCERRARLRLQAGGPRLAVPEAAEFAFEAMRSTAADPGVSAAIGRWKGCMEGKGRHYAAPDEAADDPRWAPTGPAGRSGVPLTRQEIDVASDDVRCREATGLQRLWLAVESDHQKRLIDANLRHLESNKRAYAVMLANARRG